MQKYKIVASKSQKKYTLIVSADSESEAKDKIHKDNYSILSIQEIDNKEIIGKKFLFQVEKNGEVKNGIIVGKDIFKVYIKLRDELEYNVSFLYPEGDSAHNNAEKKQKIMDQLTSGYALQKKQVKRNIENKDNEENFYLQKKLNETYLLINKAIEKFDNVFNNRELFDIEEDVFLRLEKVYEKLIHIKGSTNLSKLKEIGELALIKIAKIELQNVEEHKSKESRELLKETNTLLKQMGSHEHFIESDKDIRKKVRVFFTNITEALSSYRQGEYKKKKLTKEYIDKDSYSFLKTVLLLEKYKSKLNINTKEIYKNIKIFLNPLSSSTLKEKILLKRKVIKQNISILKAKKSGRISSYTSVKKGYGKILTIIINLFHFMGGVLAVFVYMYAILFLGIFTLKNMGISTFQINTYPIVFLLLIFILLFLLHISKNIMFLGFNIVFFSFIFIFSLVNF